MNKLARISFLLLLAFVIGIGTVDAQNYGRKKKKKKKKKPAKTERVKKEEKTDDYFDESGGFAHRLWYGGMVNFQIGPYDNTRNFLLLGISPMVGYKLTDNISVGPRATFNYFQIYQSGPNIRIRELGIGAFARMKFTPAIFAHVEYERLKVKELSDFNFLDTNNENFYAGVGYNSAMGNGFGYEIMGLYNFLEKDENIVPIELRIGFTYNF